MSTTWKIRHCQTYIQQGFRTLSKVDLFRLNVPVMVFFIEGSAVLTISQVNVPTNIPAPLSYSVISIIPLEELMNE